MPITATWETDLIYWLVIIALFTAITFWLIVSFLLWKKTTYLSRVLSHGMGRVLAQVTVVNFLVTLIFFVWLVMTVIA